MYDPLEGDPPQTDDHPGFEQFDLFFQIGLAIIQFLEAGFVRRRRTTHRCSNIHIPQNQTIRAALRSRLAGKTGSIQSGIQKFP